MVLHDQHDPGVVQRQPQGHRVDRLDAVAIEHARVDAAAGEQLTGREALVQRDPRADEGDRVGVARGRRLRAADRERPVGAVQTGVASRVVRRYEIPLEAGHQLDECDRRRAVGRAQHGRTR
jgi:hypothetical protein